MEMLNQRRGHNILLIVRKEFDCCRFSFMKICALNE